MKYEKQARAHVRRIIRDARQDWSTCVFVRCYGDDDILNDRQHEREILDAVFNCDETTITFHDTCTGRNLGSILVVLDYDREPGEIISDYTDNRYIERLITKAESKL